MVADAQWGDVPTWIAAVGTAGAFIFAAYVFWRGTVTRSRENLVSQARQVDAWVEEAEIGRFKANGVLDKREPSTEQGLDERGRFPSSTLFLTYAVVNASAQAIRNVYIWIEELGFYQSYSIGTVPPTGDKHKLIKIDPVTVEWPPSITMYSRQEYGDRLSSGLSAHLTIKFRDAAGNEFTRNGEGQLEVVPSTPARKQSRRLMPPWSRKARSRSLDE
jgi:hypothetical protein